MRCYNAAMSEAEQRPPRISQNRYRAWALVGAVFILSGVGQIHHGFETIIWPFAIPSEDYFSIGRPQIVAGILEIIAGVTMLACAIVKGRFQFSIRGLLLTVAFFCLGLWLIVSFRQINEHPLWGFLAVVVCTVSVTVAAGMYSASRHRRNP
jgi:hypothetical protein